MKNCQSDTMCSKEHKPTGVLAITDVYCLAPEGKKYITFPIRMNNPDEMIVVKINRKEMKMLDIISVLDTILLILEEDIEHYVR